MLKRIVIILSITVFIGLGLSLRLIFAQRYYEEEPMLDCEELEVVEEKLDMILALLEQKGNQKITERLDRILENQAQIKDELKIIKVRASR